MLTVLSLCLSTDFLFYPQIITEDNLVGDFHRFPGAIDKSVLIQIQSSLCESVIQTSV